MLVFWSLPSSLKWFIFLFLVCVYDIWTNLDTTSLFIQQKGRFYVILLSHWHPYYATTVHCIVEWSGPFLWKPLKEDVNWYFYYLKSQYLLKGRNISKIHSTFYSPRGRGMENSTLFKPSLIGNPYFILIMKKQQVRVIPAWQRIASSNIFFKNHIALH